VRDNLDRLLASPATNEHYSPVVIWKRLDRQRILPVPCNHWLLIQDPAPFRATLNIDGADFPRQVQSIPVRDGAVACFTPGETAAEARLNVERYAPEDRTVEARIRFLGSGPTWISAERNHWQFPIFQRCASPRPIRAQRTWKPGRRISRAIAGPVDKRSGGMARLCVDFGAIKSKYDCLLGANLHPSLPVDRHIFAKRGAGMGECRRLSLRRSISGISHLLSRGHRRSGILSPAPVTDARWKSSHCLHAAGTQYDSALFQPPDRQSVEKQTAAGRLRGAADGAPGY